ncbi:Protein kinase-like domain containing protein [Elaphomyces granulatus]
MAHAERESFVGLTIDTGFTRRECGRPRDSGGRARDACRSHSTKANILPTDGVGGADVQDTDGDSNILTALHTETPPISVPRSEAPFASVHADISYSHHPEDGLSSPFGSFYRARHPSISFNPEVRLDSGRNHGLNEPLARSPDLRASAYHRPHLRSTVRNTQLRQDDSLEAAYSTSVPGKRGAQRPFPTGRPRSGFMPDSEEAFSAGSELDRLTSLTSNSTMSPTELRTPSDGPKEMLPSPLSISPSVQRSTSLDDPLLWSAGASWGSKPRSYTCERNGNLRKAMQGSRRSTGSSSKSPASAYLSLFNSREESAPQPDDEGQMVGTEYVLGKQIGYGGFSAVKEAFKVESIGGTKRLAVKIVKKLVAGKSERENDQVQAEFDHEVRIWRYLNHPHILSLDAVYETDFATFCFTKLAIGGTLFDLIRANRNGLDMNLAKKYSYQLASAIRYLHEDARVIHRDIKLENCLLDPVSSDGTEVSNLVLCDFGMAEWMSTDNGSSSMDPYDNPADRPPPKNIGPSDSSTSVAGSLEYASPELLNSTNGLVDPAVDMWAFGVVAYTIVVGSRPFQGPFSPRITTNITKGEWDRNAVLSRNATDPDRQMALELIQGCLELDMNRRLTVRDVLDTRWFREYSNSAEEMADNSPWKL